MASPQRIRSIEWVGGLDGYVELLDQTLLPEQVRRIRCSRIDDVFEAIQRLRIRGAPAIGVAAAMGVVLGVRDCPDSPDAFEKALEQACDRLSRARPTAVNLFWALRRMRQAGAQAADRPVRERKEALLAEALRIRDEDAAMCRAIGEAGWRLVPEGGGVLTHCNAGALATADYGTALAVLYAAREHGRRFRVYATETRPLLQGSRLTAWELQQAGIEVTVIVDSAVAHVMRQGLVGLVVTGADRIAANGDTANKIGTYGIALLARAHNVPFYVAAPSSTFDLEAADGSAIPIEERDGEEIRRGFGRLTAPPGVPCYNPAFDVTPAGLIRGVITERGVIAPVDREKIHDFFAERACIGPRPQ